MVEQRPEPNAKGPLGSASKMKRMTKQRNLILQTIMNRHDHPSAQTLHAELQETQPNIGLATVYRNLSALVESGGILAVPHDGEVRYDCNTEPHAHATCNNCGNLWDIPLPRVIETSGPLIEVESIELTVRGLCTSCDA
ncbi:MAG: transcriptional repressor [Candidatus Poseidonia sp.]|nr:transcriptional repressor [Poseidonia sp.]